MQPRGVLTIVLCIVTGALAVIAYETNRRLRSTESSINKRFAQVELAVGLTSPPDILHKAVSCPRQTADTAVIVTIGQSQAANYGSGPKRTAGKATVNFNVFDGRCYEAMDPLLGATGTGANFATALGDLLVTSGQFKTVVLVPIAVGSSPLRAWIPNGQFNHRIYRTAERLAKVSLKPTLVLWQQGEANTLDDDPGGKFYANGLESVVWSFREAGINAPFLVARSTTCGSINKSAPDIRNGQLSVLNTAENIYAGPDSDALDYSLRSPDRCHFNEAGIAKLASLWAAAISNALAPKQKSPASSAVTQALKPVSDSR